MKVFLTGASGILGTDIQAACEAENWEVKGFNSQQIDITSLRSVKQAAADFNPSLIIHSAAMTNVDRCEDAKEEALLANVIGTHNLSLVAAAHQVPIVYISSCGVYGNGKTLPYNELDKTEPVNYHHYTKLVGESRVKEHNNRFLIIRPGWLFGGTTAHKKNFVEARRREAQLNPVIKSAVDKSGSPTYTKDLAAQLVVLLKAEVFGTFNMVNEGAATRFDYVSEILKYLGLANTMEAVTSNLFPRKANMPDNEVLDNMHLRLRNLNQMRTWRSALADYIQSTYL